jgi:hypothetical protein
LQAFQIDGIAFIRWEKAGLGLYLLQKHEMLPARDKNKRRLLRVTSALDLDQFVEYLRDHFLLDKCVD